MWDERTDDLLDVCLAGFAVAVWTVAVLAVSLLHPGE